MTRRRLLAVWTAAVAVGGCGGSAGGGSSSSAPVSVSAFEQCLAQRGDNVSTGTAPPIGSFGDLSTWLSLQAGKGQDRGGVFTVNGSAEAVVYDSDYDAETQDGKANDPRIVVTNNVLWVNTGTGNAADIAPCANG